MSARNVLTLTRIAAVTMAFTDNHPEDPYDLVLSLSR